MKGNIIKMTNTTGTDLNEFLVALRDLIDARLNGNAPAKDAPADAPAKGKGKKGKAAPAPEPEPEEPENDADATDDDPNAEFRAELEGKSLKALRALAIKAGFDKDEVNDADEESIVESLIADRAEQEDEAEDEDADAEEDDEAEAGEDEGDEYTREDFEAMSLKELRKVAKDEYEVAAADIKGLDKDGLIDYLLGDDEESEESEEDDEDEEEVEGYTEDDLKEMSLSELKDLAKEWEVPVRAGSKSKTIIKDLLAAFAEVEDEEDEDDDE